MAPPGEGGIAGAVAGDDVDVALGIDPRTAAALPYPRAIVVQAIGPRRGEEFCLLAQISGAVADHITVVGSDVAEGGEADVDVAIGEAQRGALVLAASDETAGGDDHRGDDIGTGG